MLNPLFPSDNDESKQPQHDDGYVFQHRHARTIQPFSKDLRAHHTSHHTSDSQPAVELIRRKLENLYSDEPDAKQEIANTTQPIAHPSKHQKFMHALSTSGKSLAQIQTEWHSYYVQLPDQEKHEVWREFYQNNARTSPYTNYVQQLTRPAITQSPLQMPNLDQGAVNPNRAVVAEHSVPPPRKPRIDRRSVKQIKKHVVDRVITNSETQVKVQEHFRSLVFGVGTGLVVLLIFLFSFFNEMVIAPFIQPSRHVNATPIILSSDSVAPSDTPEVIIPKINVQIPVVYDEPSVEEAAVQRALERGVIHYATTTAPGQQGNAAFFGHSSNNIFNKGKYKFAFVLLHELVSGDIFYLTHNKQVYTYRAFDKKVVPPSEVSVLNNIPGKTATATLITCDPPGTSTNRLVVWGEQISPDPAGASIAEAPPVTAAPTELPSEGPTLWSRFWNTIF